MKLNTEIIGILEAEAEKLGRKKLKQYRAEYERNRQNMGGVESAKRAASSLGISIPQ